MVRAAFVALVGISLSAAALATPAGTPDRTPAPAPARVASSPNFAGHAHKRTCAAPSRRHVSCFAEVVEGVVSPSVAPSILPPGYSPAQLRAAYALPSSGGAGRTVAVVDAFDLPSAESDLATYRAQFGLPACTTANGCFRKVDQNGGTSYPGVDPLHGWGPETALDLEMVSAACPDCKVLLVEGDNDRIDSLGTAVQTAVRLGALYISNSYGAPDDGNTDFSPYDATYNHPGVVVTASTGDAGYGAQFPATSPEVTAVGGTTLSPASGTARGWTESAWSGTGSGCGTVGSKPSWQHDAGCAAKSTADISAVADPVTGVAGYGPTPTAPFVSAWQVFGGTSVSAPLIAGMYALAGTPVAGTYPASYPYARPTALNDVTTGFNGVVGVQNPTTHATCSTPYLCTGSAGYDGPTGLGTPHGLAALTPGATKPAAPAAGDFNSDGRADVLARTASGALLLFEGNGAGGWLTGSGVQIGSGWNGMTAMLSPGDFDGDGHNDILARDSAGFLWLYPGNGARGWGAPRRVGSGWNGMTRIIAAHDFSGDGAPDVLAIDGLGTLWLYPGDGTGGWGAPKPVGSGWNAMTAVVGIRDFTGDGSPDLLARDSAGRLLLYAHTSAGWKLPVVVGSGWNGITAIASPGDFSGDGNDDILGRTADGGLTLYPTDGHSSWLPQRQVGSGWNAMTWIG
ncbi:MAG TPA: FG-GAP-like repeat-containing protein [Leifsonia sp.]